MIIAFCVCTLGNQPFVNVGITDEHNNETIKVSVESETEETEKFEVYLRTKKPETTFMEKLIGGWSDWEYLGQISAIDDKAVTYIEITDMNYLEGCQIGVSIPDDKALYESNILYFNES